MDPLHFVVDGQVQAWQRARRGKDGPFFTPAHVKQYQEIVRLQAQAAKGETPPVEGLAINLAVCAYLPIPTAMPKYKRERALAGLLRPITRPDLGNYVKLVEDALNFVVWRDDSQVVAYDGSGKWYSDHPRLEVTISSAEQPVTFSSGYTGHTRQALAAQGALL